MNPTLRERFDAKHMPEPMTGCWLWTAGTCTAGYGRFRGSDGRVVPAHKFSYELHVAQVPDGFEVCHKCDTPGCVNPAHLWVGTHAENIADRDRKGRGKMPDCNATKSHCPKGHPYSGENLYVIPSTGGRMCRTCIRAREQARRAHRQHRKSKA